MANGVKKSIIKRGGEYRDRYKDAYWAYLRKRVDVQKIKEGKKLLKDETINTYFTDTFYLEKHEDIPFIDWFKNSDSLQLAKERLMYHLPATRYKGYFKDMLMFRDFLVEEQNMDLASYNYLEDIEPLDDSHTNEEKMEHARTISYIELEKIAIKQKNESPREITTITTTRYRSPYISEFARKRAKGICQLCGEPAPFKREDGQPYLESHHIVWLSHGGEDSKENTVALCPNCHRKMHVVNSQEDIDKLKKANAK